MFQASEGAQYQSSANSSSRGRGRGPRGRGRGNGGRTGGRGGSNDGAKQGSSRKEPCQICKKRSHDARNCWYRYDDDDEYQNKSVGFAAAGYGVDTN
jgi:hypothetical protein